MSEMDIIINLLNKNLLRRESPVIRRVEEGTSLIDKRMSCQMRKMDKGILLINKTLENQMRTNAEEYLR
jgi:hypothetical protein